MYREKRYAFVSDYFRLKALHDHGGIYFDTDVYVYKSFDALLDCDLFLGYIYDCALGTAVLGASKGSKLIGQLLELYNQEICGADDIVNNGVLTDYFCKNIPGFKLSGKRQTLDFDAQRIEVYPKETFETGRVFGQSYSLHFADGSWHVKAKNTDSRYKLIAARLPLNLMALRQQQKANAYMGKDGKYQALYQEYKRKNADAK